LDCCTLQWGKLFFSDVQRRRPIAWRALSTPYGRHAISVTGKLALVRVAPHPAHLLINRLTFECGYSSASLREQPVRVRASGIADGGNLIYNAPAMPKEHLEDSCGWENPVAWNRFSSEPLAEHAGARADRVCMEMGQSGGQGPDSLNLAACHGAVSSRNGV